MTSHIRNGPSGPQDQKWRNMFFETANKPEERPKMEVLKSKFEDHLAQSIPSENFQSPGFGSSDQYREIKRQNDFLKHYNEELMKKFRESKSKGKPLYNDDIFFNSSHKDLKRLMASSEQIAPLIKVLDEENDLLKGELRCVSSDLASFIDIVELLIDENRELRSHISMKNQDLKKLIETIGLNDGEHIQELKHKIHILTEENNILIKHLDEMKKYKDNYDNYSYEKEQEMLKARDIYEQLNYDLEESKKREENACRQLAIIEPKYKELQEILLKEEGIIEELKHGINKHENQNKLVGNELDLLKKSLHDIESQKNQENDQLLQENTLLSHSLKDLRTELKEKEREKEGFREELARIKRDKEEINGLFEECSEEIAELKTQLGLQMSRTEQSLQRERDTNEKNESLQRDLQRISNRVQQLERQNNSLQESHKIELQSKHLSYEKLIEKLKNKQKEHLVVKDEENDRLAKEVDDLKRVNEAIRKENQALKEEVNDFKDKNVEYEHQKVIEQQKLEISYLKKELLGLKNKNEQNIARFQTEYKEELSDLRAKIEVLNEEKDRAKHTLEDLQYENNLLKKETIEVSNKNQELLETHEFYKSELQKYAKMQPESIQALINENRELRESVKMLEKKINELGLIQQQQKTPIVNSQKAEPNKVEESYQLKKVNTQNQELYQENKELKGQILNLTKKNQDSNVGVAGRNTTANIHPKRIFENERINPYLYPSPNKPMEEKEGGASGIHQGRSWMGSPPSQIGMVNTRQGTSPGIYRGEMQGKNSNYLSNLAYLNSPDSYI